MWVRGLVHNYSLGDDVRITKRLSQRSGDYLHLNLYLLLSAAGLAFIPFHLFHLFEIAVYSCFPAWRFPWVRSSPDQFTCFIVCGFSLIFACYQTSIFCGCLCIWDCFCFLFFCGFSGPFSEKWKMKSENQQNLKIFAASNSSSFTIILVSAPLIFYLLWQGSLSFLKSCHHLFRVEIVCRWWAVLFLKKKINKNKVLFLAVTFS